MKKKIWIVDTFALAGFLLAFYPAWTGYDLHEWLGLAVGLVLMLHLAQHWHWVSSMNRNMHTVKGNARLKYLLDVMMATSITTIIATGLLISSLLDLNLTHYEFWFIVHVASSYVSLALLFWKIGLHWNLIKGTVSKAIGFSGDTVKLSPEQLSRRSFLRTVGFAGIGLVVLARKLGSLQNNFKAVSAASGKSASLPADGPTPESGQNLAQGAALTPESTQTITSQTPYAQSSIVEVPATPLPEVTPVVQTWQTLCRFSCAYPGKCSKYQDNNQNGLCDRGEPIW